MNDRQEVVNDLRMNKERVRGRRGKREKRESKMKENAKGKKVGKIIFWNVAGIKNKGKEFWEKVQMFEVILLFETWVEDKEWDRIVGMLPNEWEWSGIGAIKTRNMGRAMGGIILGIRKGIKVEKISRSKDWMIECKLTIGGEKWYIVGVYNRDGNTERIRMLEREVKKEDENLLIGGDFNARIGNRGEIGWEEEVGVDMQRISKDNVVNREGEELIRVVEEKGWVIMNGNKQGDETGEWTYEKGRNRSVIDYGITNMRTWDKIAKFGVLDRENSDHNALTVEIEAEIDRENDELDKFVQDWSERGVSEFKNKVGNLRWEGKSTSHEEEWEEVKEKMKEAIAMRKRKKRPTVINTKPWWDEECWENKKKLRKLIKKEVGERREADIREARKEYKSLCDRKREEWRGREEDMIQNIKNNTQVWKYINKFRKKREGVNKGIKLEEWKRYFVELLGGEEHRPDIDIERNREGLKNEVKESRITLEEVASQIEKMKKGKAAGADELKNETWIYGGNKVALKLTKIFNRIINGEGYPEEWREGIIKVPIKKEGDSSLVQNYRGVTLTGTASKIYAGIINDRLIEEADRVEAWSKTQYGFRKHRGTIDCVKILKHVVGRKLAKNEEMYAMFVDLKAAFDNINRDILWEGMRRRRIRESLIDRIREMYSETRSRVRIGTEVTDCFWTKNGVRQGYPISPTLFNLYIADVGEFLQRGIGGVKIGKEKIATIEYADDIVLVAESEEGLGGMIKGLEKFLEGKKLSISVDKTKIMIFKKGAGRKKNRKWW